MAKSSSASCVCGGDEDGDGDSLLAWRWRWRDLAKSANEILTNLRMPRAQASG